MKCIPCFNCWQDELYDNYLKNGKFDGEPFVVPRRMHDLVVSLFWIVTTCCPLVYYVIIIFSEGTLLQKLIFFIIVLFGKCVCVCGACMRVLICILNRTYGPTVCVRECGPYVKDCNYNKRPLSL